MKLCRNPGWEGLNPAMQPAFFPHPHSDGRTPLDRLGRQRCANPLCGAVLARDNPHKRCAPCHRAHRDRPCLVCEGRGTTGRKGLASSGRVFDTCYRCDGSGIRPASKLGGMTT